VWTWTPLRQNGQTTALPLEQLDCWHELGIVFAGCLARSSASSLRGPRLSAIDAPPTENPRASHVTYRI